MRVTTHQLRCFLAVARTGTFRGAAERLHLSPSSVSEQVAQLEGIVGRRLLDRTSQGTRPTADGWQLIPMAERATTAMEDIGEWAERAHDERVRIGLMVSTPRISALVARAAGDAPGIRWEVRHLGFVDSTEALVRGDVDCVFIVDMGLAPDLGLVAFPLWGEDRVLVVAETHRLAGRASVTMDEVAGETIIGVDGTDTGAHWMDDFAAQPEATGLEGGEGSGRRSRILAITRTFEEILEMCAAGIGVNIAGASAQANYARPGLRFIPIEDARPATFYLCVRPGHRSPGLDGFVRMVRQAAAAPE